MESNTMLDDTYGKYEDCDADDLAKECINKDEIIALLEAEVKRYKQSINFIERQVYNAKESLEDTLTEINNSMKLLHQG